MSHWGIPVFKELQFVPNQKFPTRNCLVEETFDKKNKTQQFEEVYYSFSHNHGSVENGYNLKGNDPIGWSHFSLNHAYRRKGRWQKCYLTSLKRSDRE